MLVSIVERSRVADRTYTVQCAWDAEAEVWVATGDDVPGLATGADALDGLVQKLKVVIPELLDANGLLSTDEPGDIPFAIIIAERHELAPRVA